jgi:hypothetical protein
MGKQKNNRIITEGFLNFLKHASKNKSVCLLISSTVLPKISSVQKCPEVLVEPRVSSCEERLLGKEVLQCGCGLWASHRPRLPVLQKEDICTDGWFCPYLCFSGQLPVRFYMLLL